MPGGSRRAREWIPGVDDLEGRRLLSDAGRFAPPLDATTPAAAFTPLSDAGRVALPPDASSPSLGLIPASFAGGFALSVGASPLPLTFSQVSPTSEGSWPDAGGLPLVLLGRDVGLQLGHGPGLFQDLSGTVALPPRPNARMSFDPAGAHPSLFEWPPLFLPGAQARAASATAELSAPADASTPDARETGSKPATDGAAGESLAAAAPGPETPPIVVPIGAPAMAASAALPLPSVGGRPTPPATPRGDRAVPSASAPTGKPWPQLRPDGQDAAPRTTAPVAPRVEIVANRPDLGGQRTAPQSEVPLDEQAIPSAAGLLDVSPPIDRETIAVAFGRLLGHLEPDRPDAQPAESQVDLLAFIASLTVLELARRHRRGRSTREAARRPRLAPRSTLWGLS